MDAPRANRGALLARVCVYTDWCGRAPRAVAVVASEVLRINGMRSTTGHL